MSVYRWLPFDTEDIRRPANHRGWPWRLNNSDKSFEKRAVVEFRLLVHHAGSCLRRHSWSRNARSVQAIRCWNFVPQPAPSHRSCRNVVTKGDPLWRDPNHIHEAYLDDHRAPKQQRSRCRSVRSQTNKKKQQNNFFINLLYISKVAPSYARNPWLQLGQFVRNQISDQVVPEGRSTIAARRVRSVRHRSTPWTHPDSLRSIVPIVLHEIGSRHNHSHRTVFVAEQHHFT